MYIQVDGQRRSVTLHGLLSASVYHVRIVAVDCDSRSRPSRWVSVTTSAETPTRRQQRDQQHCNANAFCYHCLIAVRAVATDCIVSVGVFLFVC